MKNLLIVNTLAQRAAGFFALASIAFSMLPLAANAQTTEPPPSRQLVMKEKNLGESPRLALVLGNGDYENISKLKNAAADAIDMEIALKALGFEVISGVNLDEKGMKAKIREFGDKLLRQKGIGLFFYAGHGVQSNGRNYLIPINADIPREDEVEDSAINIQSVMGKFNTAQSELNIIILDACRNNPFAKDWSEFRALGPDDGIGKINAPKGTVLLYSTEPGKTASDGTGRNGLFTEALLEHIKKPNLELDSLYKVVARKVQEKSKNQQSPYKEGTNVSDFYFAGSVAAAGSVLPAPVVKTADEAEPEIKEKDAATIERDIWNLVKNSKNAQEFREFLTEYPNGANAEKAKKLLEQLVWDAIKTSNDPVQVENYLKEFPNGASVKTATFRLRQLKARENVEPAKTETAAVEPPRIEAATVETAKEETVKAEAEEVAESPSKKVIVPKAETPKASARTAKAKVKPAALGANKFEVRKNDLAMELVYVPAGSFMMGASEANISESYAQGRKDYKETERAWFDNEKSPHRVTFADGFWIGKTEVTQAQWKALMNDNPSNFKDCDECPVERVSWEDAKKFIEKLNARNDGLEYRLPSEAEWEYAARGGKTGVFTVPVLRIGDVAWYNVNSGTEEYKSRTHPVGTLEPNAFGLYDLHGNVAEWCEDTYAANYDGAPTDGSPNMNGNPERRVLRGGYYNDFPTNMRLTRRDHDTPPKVRRSNNGLRVVAVEKQQ